MGRRLALLIATDAYADPGLNRLQTPSQEALRLAELLADPGVGRFEKPKVLVNRPKAEIEAAVEELLAGRLPEDLVLVYIAGHGLTNDSDRLFFAAVDTRLAQRDSTAVRASYVRDLLDDSQAGSKIVLLDCCFSGIFAGDARGRADRPVEVEREVLGRGTLVLTSTTSLAYSYEGERFSDNGRSISPFTHAVIEGIETGRADTDRDGVITPESLHQYVHGVVTKLLGADQRPMLKGTASGRIELAFAPIHDDSDEDRSTGGRLALGELLDNPTIVTGRGLTCEAWEGTARLRVPIGRHEGTERDETAVARLHGRGGHVAVIGKSGSGKTTLIRTLVTSLALTHTPDEAQFHLLEGAVNGLGGLRRLPHVRWVAAPHEEDLVESMTKNLLMLMTERQRLYRQLDIESVEEFRAARDAGRLPDGPHPDFFLIIDTWQDFASDLPFVPAHAQKIANSGLHYGFHLVVTARRWQALPEDLTPLIETRWELALDDPATSVFDATLSAMLSTGRGLVRGKPFRAALPVWEAHTDPSQIRQGVTELLSSVREAWEVANPWHPDSAEYSYDNQVQPPTAEPPQSELADLLGVSHDMPVDPAALWSPRPPHDRLRVPIGVIADGSPLELDFKESSEGGIGPHGLCVGATGSGKSELLRSIVLALALTHSPDEVNFVLVDFKGGAAFQAMMALHHVAAVITNLAYELPLLDRLEDAIRSEVIRRQDLLRMAGSFSNISDYENARLGGAQLEPLPALMIIVDEFSEMLALRPALIDVFITIGRIGRSLGIHLLLASQRLEEGNLRGLDTYLSYRIGLRTFSGMESRTVLGVPDAYQLPAVPGFAYLRHGDELTLFRGATTHLPHRPTPWRQRFESASDGLVQDRLIPEHGPMPSFADEAIGYLTGHGRPAHQIWLPPLADPPTLDMLIPPGSRQEERLRVPIGVVDLPREQRRDRLTVDLTGAEGNVLIVGGALSGKSTLLRSFVAATALQNTPRQVQVLGIDLGGGGLTSLAALPHVSAIANRSEPELISRIVLEAQRIVLRREESFRIHNIDSLDAFRAFHRAGKLPDDQYEDVVLAIDNWGSFRTDFEDQAAVITALAQNGLGYGLHIVMTASRWSEVPLRLQSSMGTKLELRLGDPRESEVDQRAAAWVPVGRPGRGIVLGPYHFLAAVPRVDGNQTADGLAAAAGPLVQAVSAACDRLHAPRVQTLPKLVLAESLRPSLAPRTPALALGIDELDLAPVTVDFSVNQHLLAYGDAGAGKTALLRLLIREIIRHYGPDGARILVVDYRRGLLDVTADENMISYAATASLVESMIKDVHHLVSARQPGDDVTPQQLRDRSWWSGPEAFVLVDDYDLVARGSNNPLDALTNVLPFAPDIGLHLILARRTRGAARGIFDPVTALLQDLGVGGIVMSGDRQEGALIDNVYASRQPPGRGTLVMPGQAPRVIQVAWDPPPH